MFFSSIHVKRLGEVRVCYKETSLYARRSVRSRGEASETNRKSSPSRNIKTGITVLLKTPKIFNFSFIPFIKVRRGESLHAARCPCRVWHHGLVLLLSDLFIHQSTRGRLSLSLSLYIHIRCRASNDKSRSSEIFQICRFLKGLMPVREASRNRGCLADVS